MLAVGIVSTLVSAAGFVGVAGGRREVMRRYSIGRIAATSLAAVASVAFQGDRTWSAVVPLIGLALLHRFLVRRMFDDVRTAT